jgi:hypothetical protein
MARRRYGMVSVTLPAIICATSMSYLIRGAAAFTSPAILKMDYPPHTQLRATAHSATTRFRQPMSMLATGPFGSSETAPSLARSLGSRMFSNSEASNNRLGSSTFCNLAEHAGGGGGSGGGGIGRRSGGGGGSNGDEEGSDKSEGAEIAALLKQYGLAASQLPKGAELLDANKLSRFLASYSNSFNKWLIDIWPGWFQPTLSFQLKQILGSIRFFCTALNVRLIR